MMRNQISRISGLYGSASVRAWGATPAHPPSDGSIRQSRETFAWEFPPPPCRDGAQLSLLLFLSLSPHILPHVKSLARQKQLLQHPAASIPPSLPREQQSYPAQHRVGDATASSAFRREITEG
ncbi:hypothetical protein ATANTOWER_004977 [Ataeniobius toweri]|uniref:Uncharacterized protein n=1 Tax=Ataeniobius toweri TaxID=208326 RepID=A0ABU7AF48_9TELE|nr:hypothetical protein [Ataeniobius toweri]